MRRPAVVVFLALMLTSGCAHFSGTAYPSAPGIVVAWQGTAERPWSDLELALDAVTAEARISFPQYPEFARFTVAVFGANDRMDAPSTPNTITSSTGKAQLVIGSTELNECGPAGLSCGPIIRVRQLRAIAVPVNGQTHVATFMGGLLEVDNSALFDEIGCRLWPLLLQRRLDDDAKRATGLSSTAKVPFGYGPACDATRTRIRQRYYALRMQ